jgi:DNA modification methylase
MSNEAYKAKWGVESGQLWRLGTHLVFCGDCTSADAVWKVMGDSDKAALVITSPPYGQQRDYECGNIGDWDALMQGWCAQLPARVVNDAQILVNLGMIHENGEWQPYWEAWSEWMRRQDWRRFGLNIWHQNTGLPGDWNGRCAPCFEFIFTFNKAARDPRKWRAKRPENVTVSEKYSLRERDGYKERRASTPLAGLNPCKIPDNVWTLDRQKGRFAADMDHPAVFPVGLPAFAINTYTDPGEIVYEPFLGSGSTLLACEQTGRHCRGIELSPNYLAVVIERWWRLTGVKPQYLNPLPAAA